jgi:hypothetical protein
VRRERKDEGRVSGSQVREMSRFPLGKEDTCRGVKG